MDKAIIEFAEILSRTSNLDTIGKHSGAFAWGQPGDIIILGDTPADPHGRVCSVREQGESVSRLCRVYIDGDKVKLGFMDDYDIWKIVPAETVTINNEVLGVARQYGKIEPPKAETRWEKRARRAVKKWSHLLSFRDYDMLMLHHKTRYGTVVTAFAMGYEAGRKGVDG